jgi:hypothetical protein
MPAPPAELQPPPRRLAARPVVLVPLPPPPPAPGLQQAVATPHVVRSRGTGHGQQHRACGCQPCGLHQHVCEDTLCATHPASRLASQQTLLDGGVPRACSSHRPRPRLPLPYLLWCSRLRACWRCLCWRCPCCRCRLHLLRGHAAIRHAVECVDPAHDRRWGCHALRSHLCERLGRAVELARHQQSSRARSCMHGAADTAVYMRDWQRLPACITRSITQQGKHVCDQTPQCNRTPDGWFSGDGLRSACLSSVSTARAVVRMAATCVEIEVRGERCA